LTRVEKPSIQYLAEFRRHYPSDLWQSVFYPTRDHVISFDEFWAYYDCMGANFAAERINLFRSVALALSCLFAEKGAPPLPELRNDLIAAYLAPRHGR